MKDEKIKLLFKLLSEQKTKSIIALFFKKTATQAIRFDNYCLSDEIVMTICDQNLESETVARQMWSDEIINLAEEISRM